MTGATFTISNTGSRGALFDTVIVPPKEAAILGVSTTGQAARGRPRRRRRGHRHPGPGHLSLSYDHRLVDGADAARYLTSVKAILEAAAFEDDLYADRVP